MDRDKQAVQEETKRLFPRFWLDETPSALESRSIVKDLFGRGEFVVIYGPSGDGKTFFGIDLGAHIACGIPWRGRRVHQALVVYIAAEAGTRIARRFLAWRENRLGDAREGRIPLAVVTRGANLLNEVELAELLGALSAMSEEATMPLGVVIFDTLSRSMAGGQENSPEDMSRLIAAADRIRDDFGAATIFIHHTGKEASKGARGHSSLQAAADTVIAVVNRVATVEKVRDGHSDEQFPFDLEVVELGLDEDGDMVTTCVVRHLELAERRPVQAKLNDSEKIALEALREAIGASGEPLAATSVIPGGVRGVSVETWRATFYRRYGEDKSNETAKKAFQRAKTGLLAKTLVGASMPWAWIR